MIRAVTLPSGPTACPDCVRELARQMQQLWIGPLDVAARVNISTQSGEHNHAERGGNEHASTKQQFDPENAPFVKFRVVGRSPRGAGRPADRSSDCQALAELGAEWRHAYDLSECSLIDTFSDWSTRFMGPSTATPTNQVGTGGQESERRLRRRPGGTLIPLTIATAS